MPKAAQVVQLPAPVARRATGSSVATRYKSEIATIKAKASKAASRAREAAKTAPGKVMVGGAVGALVAGLADSKLPKLGPIPPSVAVGLVAAVGAISMDGKAGSLELSGAAVATLSPYLYGVGARAGSMI